MKRLPFVVALLAIAVTGSAAVPQESSPTVPEPKVAPPTGRKAADGIKNLVVLTLDTVRADHLGCYGYFRDTSPRLDAFAQQSLRFTRCLAPIAHTTPSHASLFTGVFPYEHGVLSNFFTRPDNERDSLSLKTSPTLRTLAEAMKASGHRTGGFVGATPVKKFTGLSAGFDEWTEPEEPRRTGKEVVDDALKFLTTHGNEPFFLWCHFFDVHGPIQPPKYPPAAYSKRYSSDKPMRAWLAERGFPEEVDGEHAGKMPCTHVCNLYDGSVRYLDDQLAVLFDRLEQSDLFNDTAVVIIADHGHGLGQHNFIGHGTCHDEQFRVPLLIRVPGVKPEVIDAQLSSIDVLPTLFGLVPSLAQPELAAQLRGEDVLRDDYVSRPIFGMAPIETGLVSYTMDRWKLIRRKSGQVELYDLDNDPYELTNVCKEHKPMCKTLVKQMTDDIQRQEKSEQLHHVGVGADGALDPKILEELKALGYTDGDEKREEKQDAKPADGGGAKPADGSEKHDE